jgi:hypothetical protein
MDRPYDNTGPMRAISLWQPWASLWLSERKVHETRHWPIYYRGWLVVHAAKKFERDIERGDPLREILDDEFGCHWAMDLPTGALIGRVRIIDCIATEHMPAGHADTDDFECGNFGPDRFAWKRGEFEVFKRPIPYRGAQGLFVIPDDVLAEVTA